MSWLLLEMGDEKRSNFVELSRVDDSRRHRAMPAVRDDRHPVLNR